MSLTTIKANRLAKVVAVLALVLVTAGYSAALQTTAAPAIVAKAPEFAKTTIRSIIVSIPDHKLALIIDGKVARIYQVATGKPTTPSPVGEFKIVNRVSNPTYYHRGQVIPAGANNPVGTRWMGLSVKSYGIHGTNQPTSIGKAASTGCIRMAKADLEELFSMVEVGDAVQISGERDEQIAAIFGTETPSVSVDMNTVAQVATASNAGGQ